MHRLKVRSPELREQFGKRELVQELVPRHLFVSFVRTQVVASNQVGVGRILVLRTLGDGNRAKALPLIHRVLLGVHHRLPELFQIKAQVQLLDSGSGLEGRHGGGHAVFRQPPGHQGLVRLQSIEGFGHLASLA